MNILAVDDEPLMLGALTECLNNIFKDNNVNGFDEIDDAMAYVLGLGNEPLDYAFLDIKLRGMSGIQLAVEIKKHKPRTKIIFCTAYSDYALDAYNVNAVGYLLKPITEKQIREKLNQLDMVLSAPRTMPQKAIRVQTFGNFDVFVNGKPIHWYREKAKELFAFLVDKRGASVTNAEIALALWEDDEKIKNVATIISSLRRTLKEYHISDVLIRSRNRTSIDTNKISCDVYDFYNGDLTAMNLYQGEYMANYSWAEITNAYLQAQT